jgi:glutathione peroxidase-family protein
MARHTSIPLTRKVQGTAALWSLEAAITHYKHRGTNFNKFLIGRDGKILKRFDSKVKPDSPELVQAVEKALGSK